MVMGDEDDDGKRCRILTKQWILGGIIYTEKVQNSLQINIWNMIHSTNLILSTYDRNVKFVAPSGISPTKRPIVVNIEIPFCCRETQVTQNTVAPS